MENTVPEPKYILRHNMGLVHCLSFHLTSNREHLYAAGSSGNVYVWDLETNRIAKQFYTGSDDSCLTMLNMNDNYLLVQQKFGSIKMYNYAESHWKTDREIRLDSYSFCRSQILSEDVIVAPLNNSNVGLYSTKSSDMITMLNSEQVSNGKKLGEIMAIKPLPSNYQQVLVIYEVGLLALWDIKARKAIHSMNIESCPMTLDFETKNMKGIIGFYSDKLQIFNLSPTKLRNKDTITLTTLGTSVTTIKPDNKICAVGGWNGRMRLYSWKNMRCLAVINEYTETVYDIVYSHKEVQSYDCKYLMAAVGLNGIENYTINLDENTTQKTLLENINNLNEDPSVDGIIVQLPLPKGLNEKEVCQAISSKKDVDGFHVENIGNLTLDYKGIIPATALGVKELLVRSNVETFGKHAVVIGRSKHVGLPIALLLHADGAGETNGLDMTTTICHINTPPDQLKQMTRLADLIVVAVGIPGLVTEDMIKPGACVIDVGINRVKDKSSNKNILVGDVDYEKVKNVAGYITPVPGGVGPMTVTMLLKNTFTVAKENSGKNN
ncbi:hypothetical protein M0802_011963 [Mischocyttarus mexicanus]|nr:hypothetical protein M0802_011963 [Mischocyttarus mexicanus]